MVMGESSGCLMQPFSYTSVLSPAETVEEGFLQGNPMHALSQSVSFGRFNSESLSWEKWSAFSHKKYVEEAEKYSRPGSVAEKKAFFEAHYKRMAEKKKAEAEAALLEQVNANSGDASETSDVTDCYDSTSVRTDNFVEAVERSEETPLLTISNEVKLKVNDGEQDKEQAKTPDVMESPVQISVVKTKVDSFATPKKETNAAEKSTEKKRSAHKWLKPLNFTPVKELGLLSSTVKRKIDNSGTDGKFPEAPKVCSTPFKTPMKVSNGLASTTPKSNQRANDNENESKTFMKRRSLATECSKFLTACKNKLQSPKISTPFRLRTEERAARRREKLEDKFNAENAQNVSQKPKLKEIAETESRKWRPTFCFTGPFPTDLNEMGRAEDPKRQVPTARPQSPNAGRKAETRPAKSTSLRPQTTTIKSNSSRKFLSKSFQSTSQSRASENVMKARENTSPNIQQA